MYDRETDGRWFHLSGVAFQGEFKGKGLKPLPSLLSDWKTWLDLHPTTLLLWQKRWSLLPYRQDTYTPYYLSEQRGVMPTRTDDDRLPPKERVLALRIGDRARAYPLSILTFYDIVNDVLGDTPVAVIFDRKREVAVVYRREVDGRVLSFKEGFEDYRGTSTLVDVETGGKWLALTGEGIEGESIGKRLEQIPVSSPFWFVWIDHNPNTHIFKER